LGYGDTPAPLVHRNLTVDQKYSLINRITDAQLQVSDQVQSILRELEVVDGRIAKVTKDKRSLPTDAEELHFLELEREVMEQLHGLIGEIAEAKVEEREASNDAVTATRAYKMAEQRAKVSEEIGIKVNEARRIRTAVTDFIDRLAKQKASDVGRYLTRMFLTLARKEAFVQDFQVNPESFAIEMKDGMGNPLNLHTLSAGEKEVFAISFLWALGKAAVQELPMVIDTPLGRLDSIHRTHIAERFLPNANRQVLVLSTDTEIDGALYERLEPYLAAAFRLDYDMQEQSTRIVSGYFAGKEVDKLVG
jgi:DNA sulfur modification protein DndD